MPTRATSILFARCILVLTVCFSAACAMQIVADAGPRDARVDSVTHGDGAFDGGADASDDGTPDETGDDVRVGDTGGCRTACGAGSTCCSAVCVDTNSDPNHCGMCGNACTAGTLCCNGMCVDTQTNVTHCGICGNGCTVAHGMPGCAAGLCSVASCTMGFGNCDMNATNGCETDTNNSGTHCGMCGNACASGPGFMGQCTMGRCTFECTAGYGDCDMVAANGCEARLSDSVGNCGMCRNACPMRANATSVCVSATCDIQCNTGFGNCNGMDTDGCEVNTATDPVNCGACGNRCMLANATAACVAGRCAVGTCAAGFTDCDATAANGCEVETRIDNNNCGVCGRRCTVGQVCNSGTCTSICSPPTLLCGAMCVNPATDEANCGVCGRVCATRANSAPFCNAGNCTPVCNRGFADCNMLEPDGCEVNTDVSVANCGSCGRVCSFANAGASCSLGACAIGACNAGFGNCDGNPANGCEVSLASSVTNCGACGRVCSAPNATSSCSGGACGIASCNAGFANCNGAVADGCEVNTNVDNANCGLCGRACGAGTACSAGACVSTCPGGTTFCGGSCVDLSSNNSNCGACGRACLAGQNCIAGACVTAGPPNDTCGGAIGINLAVPSVNIAASNVGAATNIAASCTGFAGADVYYSFTLSRRELVYADTFGATWDTVLFFATACTTSMAGSTTPGDAVCNDDAGGSGICPAEGLRSQVVAVLNPGTYYLVLSGYGSATGATNIHFEHLPVGNGPLRLLPAGATTQSGTTAGTGTLGPVCVGAGGPEDSYWWRTCPGSGSGTVTADTCASAAFDTVLYVQNGNGAGGGCNDDFCGLQSTMTASIDTASRLHQFVVDGYWTGAFGTYTVRVNRP